MRAGAPVYLEVLGFWSREAVWRRVELVERGLPHRILFAVSKHLRVSEAALDDELPGSSTSTRARSTRAPSWSGWSSWRRDIRSDSLSRLRERVRERADLARGKVDSRRPELARA